MIIISSLRPRASGCTRKCSQHQGRAVMRHKCALRVRLNIYGHLGSIVYHNYKAFKNIRSLFPSNLLFLRQKHHEEQCTTSSIYQSGYLISHKYAHYTEYKKDPYSCEQESTTRCDIMLATRNWLFIL